MSVPNQGKEVMVISSSFVGTSLGPYRVEVSWRHLMNYAAAVRDDNPVYFDDEGQEGLMGHPMFCVAVTWPLLENLGRYLKTNDFPAHILAAKLHYSEHLELHRLIRPGDHLILEGEIAAIVPHRSGTHFVVRLEARDPSGRPVFTEHTGALLRGVRCSDQGEGLEALPCAPALPREGGMVWQKKIAIDPFHSYHYDGCTIIFSPSTRPVGTPIRLDYPVSSCRGPLP